MAALRDRVRSLLLIAWLLTWGEAARAQEDVLEASKQSSASTHPATARAGPADASSVDDDSQPLEESIRVSGVANCVEQTRLVAHVRMWLGQPRVKRGLSVHVHGSPHSADALSFDLTGRGATRRRTFDPYPRNCDELHAVLGLAIALAIDESHAQQLLDAAVARPRPIRRLAFQVSAAYAVLPGAAVGAQLGTELAAGAWFSLRLEALTLYAFRQEIPYSEGRFDAWLGAGSAQACAGGSLTGTVRLALCLGAAAGAIRAWGRGYAPDRSATGFWLAVRSGIRLEFRAGLRWLADLEVISGIYSPRFGARQRDGETLTRRPDAAGVALSLGPALSF